MGDIANKDIRVLTDGKIGSGHKALLLLLLRKSSGGVYVGTLTELARDLNVTLASVSINMKQLEAKGYVKRNYSTGKPGSCQILI